MHEGRKMRVKLVYPGEPRETIDQDLLKIDGHIGYRGNRTHRYHHFEIITMENLKRVLACLPSDGEVTIVY